MFHLMPRKKVTDLPPARKTYAPLSLLREEFAPLFDRLFGNLPMPFETMWEAPIPWGLEMEDADDVVLIRAELPGFEVADIHVHLTGKLLTIKAERKEPGEVKEKGVAEERTAESYDRTLTVPEGIDPEKVEARYHNGVLEVRLPKVPGAKPRRIEVKV